uniref:Reverse transcriptase domain-containing protein n=1 Tax=Tanacetum cinerariifolium TaxID=118510 RepID=A0A699GWX0_TANCI|nr:reverse transcriptase domain-containing protein [Tanacetum cinerariifolium]
MANTTSLVTTVTKPAINPGDADTTPRVNIQEFYEEYYEDILPIIMEKVHHDRRKNVHTRLDFGEGHQRQSAFDRLSKTYSPSMTKSRPQETDSRDPPWGRSCARGLNTSRNDRPKDRERFRSAGESYDDSFSHSYHDRDRSRHMKRRRDNKSPPSSLSRKDPFTPQIRNFESSRRTRMPKNVKTYDGTGDPEDHVKVFQAAAQVERWAMPTWCHMFNSTLIGAARVWFNELPLKSIDGYKDLKEAFLAYFMQQKKYVKDPVEIHNIKQRDRETIEDFMERFKAETRRMKGAPECMRISGFMHGVNNPELTKRPNEHVLKTMEEMMITTTAFIREEAAAASKKKGDVSWKAQDQSKRQNSYKRSDFRGHSREGRGSNRFTPLTRTPKEILAAEASKFQLPPPMVTPVEKRSSNKFCDFHNDKGHNTDECMQLKKQIEELSQMVPATTSLTGFSGETIWPLGQLSLLVIIGDATHSTRAWINFMIVKSLSPYNGIIERSRLRAIPAVPSTVHGMLKFPVEGGIVTIRNIILIPTECASVITSSVVPSEERTQELGHFAWQPSDMTGVSRSVAKHRLNIREGYSPVRQKKRGQAPKRAKAIQAEVQKLVETGIMREFYYNDWLSNPVMIQLAEANEEKTTFHTRQAVYCYTKMPFGLKNAGATYQRLMDKAFEGQIGRNIEINMKLNPKKCSFRLAEGVFLGPRTSITGQILVDFLIEMSREDPQAVPVAETQEEPWTLFTDGSSCVDGSGAGLILTIPEGVEFTYVLRFQFTASNNEAKYEALIAGLRIAARMGVKDVHVSVDSKLVANQVLGTYVAKEDNMVKYLEIVRSLLRALVQTGTSRSAQRQIHKGERSGNGDRGRRTDLDDTVSGLLKRSPPRRQEGGKKTPPQGPTIRVNRGGPLQTVVPYIVVKMRQTAPGGPLTPITASWPFYKWGIDIAGPFPEGPGKDNIVCRFGIPGEIVSDNGKHFSDNLFKDWCDKLNITQRSTSVKHPQSNGLMKRANRSLGEGIKSRLGEGNKNWIDELPHVLWAHRTMIKLSHGDTPFSLTYGTEAVIPTDIGMPTYRTATVDVVSNDEELRLNLDLLEERRERAAICEAKAKSKMTKYYNARVRGVTFKPGDFVYRSNDASHAVAGGKLGPKWEGPYEVTEALGNGP